MSTSMIARVATFTLFAALVAPAVGAQAVPTVQQAEVRKDKPRLFTADLGFVKTSGNTDLTTLNLNEKIAFERMGWGLEQYFGSIYVGSSRVDLQACKLEYSIVSPK